MSDLRSNLIRLAATMPKGSANRKALLDVLAAEVKCNGEDGCKKPVFYIDSKGYTYCESHGDSLKSGGRKGVRKLKPGEAKKLEKSATDKEASDTWMRRLEPLQAQFMREVVAHAESILGDEGVTNMQTGPNFIAGVLSGEKLSIYWMWQRGDIASKMTVGSKRSEDTLPPLSLSPMNVASESIYKHFNALD